MEKPIKNRGVFVKLLWLGIVFCVVISTILLASCANDKYDTNHYFIEFNKKQATFVLPSSAKLSVQKQTKYYVYEEVIADNTKESKDFVKYTFDNSIDTSTYIFRIEQNDAITKAGYFQKEGKFKIPIVAQSDNDSVQTEIVETANLMLTNVGNNYFKILQIGENFDLTAFRNSAIVNSLVGNVQIEPTFECSIVKGDSISIDRVKENVFTIKAVKTGVTQVKLTYGQIDVLTNSKLKKYSACGDNMQIVITFAVGDSYTTDIQVTADNREFDSEFDIVYFEGDSGEFEIETLNTSKVICNGNEITGKNGKFVLGINQGSNIIEIINGGKSKFMTIYGAKIELDVIGECVVGGEITIKVKGILNVLPKLSGIYNPTQKFANSPTPSNGSNLYAIIPNMTDDKVFVADNVSQYDFSQNTIIKFVIKKEYLINNKLNVNLKFKAEWWGLALGAHRDIGKSGSQTNINAEKYSADVGFLPPLEIDVLL